MHNRPSNDSSITDKDSDKHVVASPISPLPPPTQQQPTEPEEEEEDDNPDAWKPSVYRVLFYLSILSLLVGITAAFVFSQVSIEKKRSIRKLV